MTKKQDTRVADEADVVDRRRQEQDALTQVDALEAELRSIPEALAKAAERPDPERIVQLRQRREELPAHLLAAKVVVMRRRIERFALEEQLAKAQGPALAETWEQTKAAYDRAMKAYADAERELSQTQNAERLARSNRADAERELQQLLADVGREPGPVVHSRIHALRPGSAA